MKAPVIETFRMIIESTAGADWGPGGCPINWRGAGVIAAERDVCPRTLYRHIIEIEKAGMLERILPGNGRRRRADLGMVKGLSFAPLIRNREALIEKASRAHEREQERRHQLERLYENRRSHKLARQALREIDPEHPALDLRLPRITPTKVRDVAGIEAVMVEQQAVVDAVARAAGLAEPSKVPATAKAAPGVENAHAPRPAETSAKSRQEGSEAPVDRSKTAKMSDEAGQKTDTHKETLKYVSVGCANHNDSPQRQEPPRAEPDNPPDPVKMGTIPRNLSPPPGGSWPSLTDAALREMMTTAMRDRFDHATGDANARLHAACTDSLDRLGIWWTLWKRAVAAMGLMQAMVVLVVIDRNRHHPTDPVVKPGAYLNGMIRLHECGQLNLERSVWGILDRHRKGLQKRSATDTPRPRPKPEGRRADHAFPERGSIAHTRWAAICFEEGCTRDRTQVGDLFRNYARSQRIWLDRSDVETRFREWLRRLDGRDRDGRGAPPPRNSTPNLAAGQANRASAPAPETRDDRDAEVDRWWRRLSEEERRVAEELHGGPDGDDPVECELTGRTIEGPGAWEIRHLAFEAAHPDRKRRRELPDSLSILDLHRLGGRA